MRARRGIAIACAVGLLAGIAAAGPATARTTVFHFNAVGPGVQAIWVNGDVTTGLVVFHQLNAPGTRGFFEDVIVFQDGLDAEGNPWSAQYDSWDAPVQPTISIHQPLDTADVEATVLYVGCVEGTCPADLPDAVDVSEAWTGVGPIERAVNPAGHGENDPGALLWVSHGANFFRDAVIAAEDPFDGAFGDLGTLDMAGFFDVHLGNVIVCHPGATCP